VATRLKLGPSSLAPRLLTLSRAGTLPGSLSEIPQMLSEAGPRSSQAMNQLREAEYADCALGMTGSVGYLKFLDVPPEM
jgi:hypothetical protein